MAEIVIGSTYSLKFTKDTTTTIIVTRHVPNRINGTVIYAWAFGGVKIIIPPPEVDDAERVIRALERAMRSTPHWDQSSRIEVQFKDCTHPDCLCLVQAEAALQG